MKVSESELALLRELVDRTKNPQEATTINLGFEPLRPRPTCRGNCYATCYGNCAGDCLGSCYRSCGTSCQNTCAGGAARVLER